MEERIANSRRACLLRASRDPEEPAPPAKTMATVVARRRRAPGRARTRERWHAEPRRSRAAKRRRFRLLLPVVVLTVMAFLYYRPLASYLETRSELGARQAQVVALRAEKVRLERQARANDERRCARP